MKTERLPYPLSLPKRRQGDRWSVRKSLAFVVASSALAWIGVAVLLKATL